MNEDKIAVLVRVAGDTVDALRAYDAACISTFGGLPVHAGRAGQELMDLIRSVENLGAVLSRLNSEPAAIHRL